MKNQHRELVILRTFAACIAVGMILLSMSAFQSNQNERFSTIDVERINIIESDGTVKMVITNANHFPTKGDSINSTTYHERKKRAGMLFFTEDGKECGGLIYDGAKQEDGHSAGLSLTYDQYDGDQVMQLLTTDYKKGDRRMVASALTFNDRAVNETQDGNRLINEELRAIKDPKERREKYNTYVAQGRIGATPRVMLGKTSSENNGLSLFDDQGNYRAQFSIDKDNNVQLIAYDQNGNVTGSWPN